MGVELVKVSFPFDSKCPREDQRADVVEELRRLASCEPIGSMWHDNGPYRLYATDPDLQKWLNAAAAALNEGHGAAAVHYMRGALFSLEALLLNKHHDLAAVGRHKLKTDRLKGRRTNPKPR